MTEPAARRHERQAPMSTTQTTNIERVRSNLASIRYNLREASKLMEGNVYDETLIIINKLLKRTTALLNPND